MAEPEPAFRNGIAFPLEEVPLLSPVDLCSRAVERCSAGARIAGYFAVPKTRQAGEHDVLLVLAEDAERRLWVGRTSAEGEPLPSLMPDLPSAQAFEREMHEEHGIDFVGHPWLKPLRKHPELAAGAAGTAHPFFQVAGSGVHEVAVGPVHAGIIEPGHFRFQCHGERVLSLEIQLGYQQRGVEALLQSAAPARRLLIAESIAGDTAVGHALAHCMAMEALAGAPVPRRANSLRAIALELERVANHVGDLGALCGDVAYLPGASYLGRLRGTFLNLLLDLSGNRHGRGLLCAGGVRRGVDAEKGRALADQIGAVAVELSEIVDMVFNASSVLARFEHTGVVAFEAARDLGLVGPIARASGIATDVRHCHPTGVYEKAGFSPALSSDGDVMARATVRWTEVRHALGFVQQALGQLSDGELANEVGQYRPNQMVVALVEGWRGEIAHMALTNQSGELRGYKVVDPSFHNWFALAMAMRNNEISDFPLCNKSFNLSYAGHDL